MMMNVKGEGSQKAINMAQVPEVTSDSIGVKTYPPLLIPMF
jgi:hypothetical protein